MKRIISFLVIICLVIPMFSVGCTKDKSVKTRCYEQYNEVLNRYLKKYGQPEIVDSNKIWNNSIKENVVQGGDFYVCRGVCFAELINIDNKKPEELMVVYAHNDFIDVMDNSEKLNKLIKKGARAYTMEVWKYNSNKTKRIFRGEVMNYYRDVVPNSDIIFGKMNKGIMIRNGFKGGLGVKDMEINDYSYVDNEFVQVNQCCETEGGEVFINNRKVGGTVDEVVKKETESDNYFEDNVEEIITYSLLARKDAINDSTNPILRANATIKKINDYLIVSKDSDSYKEME